MSKKMLSLQGLVSVLLLTSLTSWSASPMLDDRDLSENTDYGVVVGGFLDFSKQTNFKGEIDSMGKFVELSRESSLATIGFSAFGRMALMLNIGSSSAKGKLAALATSPDVKTQVCFETKPALVWGGKLGVQLYNEGCVKAMGCAQYHQTSMPVKMITGVVSRRQYSLIPSFDTANNKLGLYIVPSEAADFVDPTQAYTPDAIMISMPHVMYDPSNVNLDFSQYEVGLLFGYGQQNMMYVGAKIIGGTSTLVTSDTMVHNAIGQDLGVLLKGVLGTKESMTKLEGTRACYIAPVVGFSLCGKGLNVDVCTSLLAQQDLTVRACIAF